MKKDVLFLLSHAEVSVGEEVGFFSFFFLVVVVVLRVYFKSCIAQGGT